MEYLYLNSKPDLSSTNFKLVKVTKIGGVFRHDFSPLDNNGEKIDFLTSYGELIDQDSQRAHSFEVHNYDFYSYLIDAAINTGNYDASRGFIRTIAEFFSENNSNYSDYVQIDHQSSPLKLYDPASIDPNNLPKDKDIKPHFYSDVFFRALEDKYGSSAQLHFAVIEVEEENKLTFRISGNETTGYFNLSYRPPYKGLSLI